MNPEFRKIAKHHLVFIAVSFIAALALTVLLAEGETTENSKANTPSFKKKGGATKQNKPQRPNVLFVLTDDQPTSTLRVMDKTTSWFEQNGTVFPNHFVATPICCPSRSSFLTGQYGHNSGVLNNKGAIVFQKKKLIYDRKIRIWRKEEVFPKKRSIACDLQRFGYKTAIFGKYLNGWENRSKKNPAGNIPTCFGPGSWIGFDENNLGSRKSDFKDRPIRAPESDRFLTTKAIDFINNAQSPWFSFLSLHSPHLPLESPDGYENWQFKNKYRPSLAERTLKGNKKKPDYVQKAVKKYKKKYEVLTPNIYARGQERMVKSVDDQFGKILEALKAKNELDNTIIVFSSDNGFLWGDHGLHGKFYPYLDSVRTPLMISYPKKVPRGKIDSRLASNVDFAPTIYDLTETRPTSHSVDGYSLFSGYKRKWLLTESGANGVTPYWAAAISYKYHYIESESGRSPESLLEKSPEKALPQKSSDIENYEFYRLKEADGEEIMNIYKENSQLKKMSFALQKKAWMPWVDHMGRKQIGCAGTIFSGSKNPCP